MTDLAQDAPQRVHSPLAMEQDEAFQLALDYGVELLAPIVDAALSRVADKFIEQVLGLRAAADDPLDDADFARLRQYWDEEVPALSEQFANAYSGAGRATLATYGAQAASLTTQLRTSYMETASNRLSQVGDSLWREARATLAAGNLAGESYPQLSSRLERAFARDGQYLGASRAERIARTEVQSAVNHGTLDATKAAEGGYRPQYKTWLATLDSRTREEHAEADGQTVPIDAPFDVGGDLMEYPGDPAGSAANTINCRCTMVFGDDPDGIPVDADRQLGQVIDYCTVDLAADAADGCAMYDQPFELDRQELQWVPPDREAEGHLFDDSALTLEDRQAARRWSSGEFEVVNDALRSGQSSSLVDDLDEAISRTTTDGPAVAYRGVSGVDMPPPGGTLADPGYLATAANPDVAVGFGDTLMEIRMPDGTPYLKLETESEVLLGRNTELRLVGRRDIDIGGREHDALVFEVVPRGVQASGHPRLRVAASDTVSTTELGARQEEPAMTDVLDAPELAASDTVTEPEMTFHTARIRGLTLCDISAFTEATVITIGEPDENGFAPVEGVATVEGIPTGDGRIYLENCFRWEEPTELGYPFRWDIEDDGAHMGAVTVGRVDEFVRDGNLIRFRGVVDTNLQWGNVAYGSLQRKILGWVSVDLDDIPMDSVEVEYTMDVEAAATGTPGLDLAEDDTDWDADAAHNRIVELATGEDDEIDYDLLAATHLWVPDDAEVTDPANWHLPYADVFEDDPRLRAVPAGVDWAYAEVVRMLDEEILSEDEADAMFAVLDVYLDRLEERAEGDDESDDESDDDEVVDEDLEASAWGEFQAMPAMPAAFFTEPVLADTDEYVHYENGRIWGWVAQEGVCHDAFSGQCVGAPLGTVELDRFNRQPITLDDGSTVKVGVFTMDAGHDNDGAEAGTMKAQFDNTRTVAGLVRVGLAKDADGNDRGLWFSGVAAPWLSEWDRHVLLACRPSGHWKRDGAARGRNGGPRWSLRAVLSVPVPGFPNKVAASALRATAAVIRSNMALAASAKPEPLELEPMVDPEQEFARLVASFVADELEQRAARRAEVAQMSAEFDDLRRDEARRIAGSLG